MRAVLILVFMLLLVSMPASAQEEGVGLITVEDLRDTCRSALELQEQLEQGASDNLPSEVVRTLRCVSFVQGIVAAVVRLGAAGFMVDPLYESSFCFPSGTTPTQWVGEFVEWVEANPDKLQMASVDGFLLALIETYPCDTDDRPDDQVQEK